MINNVKKFPVCSWVMGQQVDILEIGIEKGRAEGIRVLIETCKELGLSREDTFVRTKEKFGLTNDAAEKWIEKYWN